MQLVSVLLIVCIICNLEATDLQITFKNNQTLQNWTRYLLKKNFPDIFNGLFFFSPWTLDKKFLEASFMKNVLKCPAAFWIRIIR